MPDSSLWILWCFKEDKMALFRKYQTCFRVWPKTDCQKYFEGFFLSRQKLMGSQECATPRWGSVQSGIVNFNILLNLVTGLRFDFVWTWLARLQAHKMSKIIGNIFGAKEWKIDFLLPKFLQTACYYYNGLQLRLWLVW